MGPSQSTVFGVIVFLVVAPLLLRLLLMVVIIFHVFMPLLEMRSFLAWSGQWTFTFKMEGRILHTCKTACKFCHFKNLLIC